ncbi:MAG: flagellar type III secretion system protein FlhB [Rhodospirillales bacterium]|nr:flagellar type III secretion system protein FlhB [Rhodospirillales bacterium]
MAEEDGASPGEKTEPATQRRRQRAREAGQVAISRELASFAGLAAGIGVLLAAGGPLAKGLAVRLSVFLAQADSASLAGSLGLQRAGVAALLAVAPLVLLVLVAGAGAVLGQSGFLVSGALLKPDLTRLDPRKGLRRLFAAESLVEAGKSVVKIAVIAAALWWSLSGAVERLILFAFDGPQHLPLHLLPLLGGVAWVILGMQAAIAGVDLLFVHRRFSRRLRMSREDIRQELKETDGDPAIKGRIRQIRMQRARRRIRAAVAKATVVVTNPTHYAVALAYDRGTSAAPRVVAKGTDLMAARIREIAEEHRVPIVANPPLARALFRVELDREIQPEHYQAVAELIAYVWSLRQGSLRQGSLRQGSRPAGA